MILHLHFRFQFCQIYQLPEIHFHILESHRHSRNFLCLTMKKINRLLNFHFCCNLESLDRFQFRLFCCPVQGKNNIFFLFLIIFFLFQISLIQKIITKFKFFWLKNKKNNLPKKSKSYMKGFHSHIFQNQVDPFLTFLFLFK